MWLLNILGCSWHIKMSNSITLNKFSSVCILEHLNVEKVELAIKLTTYRIILVRIISSYCSDLYPLTCEQQYLNILENTIVSL